MNLNMKTKNVACDEESGARRKDVEVPPRKKLKQARLSFQILSPGVESSSSLHKSNKRKLSDSTDDIKIIKTIRPNNSCQLRETKGNVGSPTFSGVCKQSSDSANKTLSTPCAGKEIIGHANSSVETSEVFETVIISNETESGAVKNSVSLNKVDRKLKNNSSKGKEESYISNEGTADGGVDAEVIVLSDSDSNAEKEDLTISSCNITPTQAQDKVSKNETVGSRQDVAKSPCVTDSEQSETDNSPIAVKDSSCGSESEKEQLSAEERTANCESNVSKQISPKSIDTKVNKYVPPDVKTPKSSPPQCSLSEINSKKNTTDISRTPSSSNQNSFCDSNFEACTPDSGSPGSTQKIRKLTPKQLLKQLESAKKKEEKERQRQEREKKKAEEKEEREKKKAEDKEEKLRQKLEKEEQKKKEKEEREEQKRKEKEEKEELKKKEKEEKEKKKQVELEIKNEEKRKKEDKRQAEAAAFTSFFLPKKAEPKPSEEPKVKAEENFMPFEVKADMRLAPSTRTKLTEEVKRSLDQCIESQSADQLYLDQIRSKQIIPQTRPCTWALSDFKDDVLILDDDDIPSSVTSNIVESYPTAGQLPHPKLLQFWENRRPPYWGTWRKKSQSIGPRNPFSIDEKFFDYEVDSDDEWEEEEPGESLHGSDDEKESEDEYEVDNEFFVPHGYLSDEENTGQEDEDQSPEMLKIKLKLLELEFEEEMKQKTERLKPRLLGCIWIDSKTSDYAGSQLLKLLNPYQAVYQNGPIVTSASDSATAMGSPESSDQIPSPATPLLKKKKRKFPEAAIPALIKLIHGNANRREFLVKEFLAYWDREQQKSIDGVGEGLAEGNVSASPSHDIFKKSVSNKIKELATWLACPDAGPMNGRMCWYVPSEIRAAHGLPDITLPNTLWNYTFKPKRRKSDIQTPTTAPALGSETNPKQLITKFTKKMTEVECRKQFSTAPVAEETPNKRQENESSPHNDKTQKKLMFSSPSRAFTLSKTGEQHKKKGLVSLPKGQELPKARKNSLMKFMKQQGSRSSGGNRIIPHFLNSDKLDHGGEECIVLSD